MYAPERQQAIVERARHDGRVDVTELATTLEVTTETIRRDLSVLERHGVLRRVHGGAIPVDKLGFDPNDHPCDTTMAAEQDRIAKAAVDEIPTTGTVLLDADTTTARLAGLLPDESRLTVVTNAAGLLRTLTAHPRVTVLLLGGTVHTPAMATVDDRTLRDLADTNVDVAFLGTDGISPTRGMTTTDNRSAAVKRAMLNAARRVVVLADHSKVGADQLARFGGLDQVDSVITDSGLDPEPTRQLAESGPSVVRS